VYIQNLIRLRKIFWIVDLGLKQRNPEALGLVHWREKVWQLKGQRIRRHNEKIKSQSLHCSD
jgi:hypothetical protein